MSEFIRSKEIMPGNHESSLESAIEKNKEILDEKKRHEMLEKNETIKKSLEQINEIDQESSEDVKSNFNLDQNKTQENFQEYDMMKTHAQTEYLAEIANELGTNEKRFAKIIHKPFIDNSSEVLAKTLIRPSGILCGSIFTLIGSIYYLIISRSTGFSYNFFVALLLFAGGFLLGILIEFVLRLIFTD